jgi:uncharacterized membrane protein HdeD (DUF308 family)
MMDGEIRREETAFAKNWWLFLITGIAWLLVAILVLRFDITSVTTVGILIGVMFLGAAINEFLVSGTISGGWKWAHVFLGVLFVLGALWGFFEPIDTVFAIASILGFLLVLMGAMYIIEAVLSREQNPMWVLGLVAGILLVLLAFWVAAQNFYQGRIALILLWVGFMSIFRGVGELVTAFHLHHVKRLSEAGSAAVV